jgi:hypothetical protein
MRREGVNMETRAQRADLKSKRTVVGLLEDLLAVVATLRGDVLERLEVRLLEHLCVEYCTQTSMSVFVCPWSARLHEETIRVGL